MGLLKTLCSASLVAAVFAAPLRVVEKRSTYPSSWRRLNDQPSPDMIIPLKFGLTQQNLDRLDEVLESIAHPDSVTYGKHWTKDQVRDFFAASDESTRAVRSWLIEEGLEEVELSHSKTWLTVKVPLSKAEQLLAAKYHSFEHESGEQRIACDSYSVPAHIRQHIELVTPTLHFDRPEGVARPSHGLNKRSTPKPTVAQGVAKAIGQPGSGTEPKLAPGGLRKAYQDKKHNLKNCSAVTTLDCLRAQYNYYYTPKAADKNTFGIVEYTPQAYVPSDLDLFFANYSPSLVGSRPVLYSIDNGVVQQEQKGFDFNGESNLDLEYAMGLVGPEQKVGLYQVGDEVQGASFNNLLDGIDGAYCTTEGGDDPTQDGIYPANVNCGVAPQSYVISTSYGYNEADLTPAYEQRQCREYAKLGMMGVTFVYSSGDYGVAGNSGNCINAADGSFSPNGTVFNPAFPSTCPYVTSVGATQIQPGKNVNAPEEACQTVIYSGGGFSNVFPLPSYQSSQVKDYFKKHNPGYSAAQYNNSQTTRGYPDISANGANYIVAIDGDFALVYGTSASAPVVGSMLSSINDARLASGKGPIGFINPALYSKSFKNAYNDIKLGGNQGCGTPGFQAVDGWDPVTGLGTPKFDKLLKAFLSLP
ncbi:hypothetical protein OIO90_005897 [Microbotryomycetes sp. JL221]|nr:hypothetical protein OIO90_005897 [Microbotryomycetes sp. JL221]